MKPTISWVLVVVVLLVHWTGALARGDEAPESKVLARLIGTWKDEATIKAGEGTAAADLPKQETSTYQMKWIAKGRILECRGSTSEGKKKTLLVVTFDPKKKTFHRWFFHSEGYTSESTGQWDEKAKTLTWTAEVGGKTEVSVWKFNKDNAFDWTRMAKDSKGNVSANMKGTAVREK